MTPTSLVVTPLPAPPVVVVVAGAPHVAQIRVAGVVRYP